MRLVMGNDPPGQFTRVLHPRVGRHGEPPDNVIPVGRSVIVPANGSLPNIVLSPRSYFRTVRALERERFDVLHLHEPMTPTICLTALIRARCPLVATFHASGDLGWMKYGAPLWGFLIDRIDHRIAVSERAKESQNRWLPGEYEVIPNGVLVPPAAPAGGREHRVVFAGQAGAAQGPARAAAGMAGDPLAHRAPADGGGRGPPRRPPAAREAASPGRGDRRRRVPEPGGAHRDAAPGQGAHRARRSGRRASAWCSRALSPVRSPWSRRTSPATERYSRPRRPSQCRRTTRLRSSTPSPASSVTRRSGSGWASAARSLAVERYSWPTIARRLERIYEAVTGLDASRGASRVKSVAASLELRLDAGGRRDRRPRARVRRHLVARPGMGRRSWTPSDIVVWSWIVLAFLLNVVSTLFRALSWQPDRRAGAATRAPAQAHRTSSRRSASGCSRTPSCPVAWASSRGSRRFAVTSPMRRPGTSATLVGTVFAHRLFDLVPATVLVVWVLLTAEVPHWAVTSRS